MQCCCADEQEALNSIMQDLAELHRCSRPAMFLPDLGKPKASSPKNQVGMLLICCSARGWTVVRLTVFSLLLEWRQSEVWVQRGKEVRLPASVVPLMWSCAALYLHHDFCLPSSQCRILQFPRPVKLDDLKAKAKVAFGQMMDLHYTNNEVGSKEKWVNSCHYPGL